MVPEEVKKFIREALAAGQGISAIRKSLEEAGWGADILAEAFPSGHVHAPTPATVLGALAFFLLIGTVAYLWEERLDLANTNDQKVRDFYVQLAEAKVSFTDAGELVFPDEQNFRTRRTEYIDQKADFIEVDLRKMSLTLYDDGFAKKTYPVMTKGKERSWWETPTGDYTVLAKEANAYSSIGNVWMPYSMQFYGNYFVHGWPYYENGEPVSSAYSGGCIRLSTEDAKEVFAFATKGMPILVLEGETDESFGALTASMTATQVPAVGAKAFLIADLSTGATIIERAGDERLPIASLTKLMTSVVAHEVIYLGRSIKASPQVVAAVAKSIFAPHAGDRYIGLDLLYPLLMQSSNESADLLANFAGKARFISNMNIKAGSIQMADTKFADASGRSAENISTASDLVKLLQYIYFKRPFLFDITRGVAFDNVGLIKIGDTIAIDTLTNVNEFVGDPDLIGVKNGETTAAGQTLASVWNVHTKTGDVPVAVVVLGSEDRRSDSEALVTWLRANYSTVGAANQLTF